MLFSAYFDLVELVYKMIFKTHIFFALHLYPNQFSFLLTMKAFIFLQNYQAKMTRPIDPNLTQIFGYGFGNFGFRSTHMTRISIRVWVRVQKIWVRVSSVG